ncbi:Pfs, NB-ARC and ankyrin domain protein [Paraphoma chrysanthemicola]|nr:Pfs, NB-ARC and ankyrin domain protein [Paraphoma chrysanthemicola]
MPRRLRREDYTVGWVCALPVELAAAKAMLDEEHENAIREVGDNDENVYCMGSVAGHNVVIVCLPAGHIGTNPAAAVATQMRTAFKGIRFGLMVGIGGGVPSGEADIRLGDVVVSQPQWNFGGVVQYDFGRTTPNGLERVGSLNSPPQILLSAVSTVQASAILRKSTLSEHLSTFECIPPFQRRRAGPDVLFEAAYNHEHGATCDQCSVESRQSRPERESGAEVTVHYGTIASGNQVMKDAAERDRVSAELGGVLCFEMEAAGLMHSFPCLVIRGISDYADTHKNYKWQSHAAGTAAAYAKELLSVIPAAEVMNTRRAEDAMNGASKRCLQSSSPNHAPHKRTKTDISGSSESGFAEQQTVALPIHSQEPSQTPLNDEQRQSLLDSLRFEQIDARQMTIKSAHAKTCRWLLKSEQYLSWLDTTKLDKHHGFLWIKGKAGTGKSTLMKFALVNAHKTMKGCTVLSFFFNARGEDIEKATIGTYRSLLLQLLERLPALQSVFDSLSLSTSSFSTDHQWNVESLKTLLEQAVRGLGDSSVICFIDALDECEEEQVRDMIQFFEHIGDLAVSNGIRFQVCFSSRHYPYITIRNGLELVLEGQEGHSQDITNYIETELKIGKSKTAQQIRAELKEKASGIFLWVVLVVGILNKEFDDGQVHALRRRLKAIPGDLHKLFRDILTRDSHNKDRLVLCIQWVLFARQPLSPAQLYHALLLNIDPDAISEWDPEETTKDDIKRFLLNSSKGLTEITVSKEPKAQFIHESVRDFLLKENGLGKIWPEFGSNFQGQSHERLKQCCLDYISVDVATPLKIPDDLPKASSQQAASLRNLATKTFPFLEYAVRNVLYHADTAEGGGISQADFLDSFPLPRWVKLDNLFKKHEVRRHKDNVSLLYILAELDAANLIGVIGSVSRCLDVEAERYGCPLFAAAALRSEKALQVCMDSMEMQRADRSPAAALDDQQSQHKSAQRTARRGYVYSKSKNLLLNAAELGHDGVLTLLLRSGKLRIDSKDSRDRTVLWWASKNECERAMRWLLDSDPAFVNSKGKDNQSLLYIAAEQGNKAVVALLLDKGADVNAQGGRYGNALYAASAGGHKEIATLLLDKGANVNAQGGLHSNALQAASAEGNKDIVTLLLDKGADVNAQGGCYGNALYAASVRGHKGIATLLLDKGADVNAQGGEYGNALQAALARGDKGIATLLLDKGVDVNAQGWRVRQRTSGGLS